MKFRLLSFVSVLTLTVPAAVPASSAPDFRGWEGMRVIHQQSQPQVVRGGDLFGDGREELVVVNTRQSRLDIYRWLPAGERTHETDADPERPNELPMAPEMEILELPLEELPRDVLVVPGKEGEPADLVILVAPPNRVLRYRRSEGEDTGWKMTADWDLLPGSVGGTNPLLLYPGSGDTAPELLVSFEEGIQRLRLDPERRVRWFQPKERLNRRAWWQVDLDGNGEPELIEWVRQQRQSLRWYQAADGELLPARGLSERTFQAVEVLALEGRPDQLLLLGGAQEGILRRYRLERDEASPVGSQQTLTLGGRSSWTGFELDGEPVLVTSGAEQPRLELFALSGDGWSARGNFPAVRGIRGLAAPVAAPGTLLIWADEAPDLYRSRWENGRLSFPAPMPPSEDGGERRIVALARDGDAVWWAQQVGEALDIHFWPAGADEPVKTRFPGVGGNLAGVNRLDDRRLLLMETYGRNAKLAVLDADGSVDVREPARLRRARLEDFFPIAVEGERKLGRLVDGVWQWLGEDLHAEDQIMLPEGLQMAAYLPRENGEAWVLEQGGRTLHRMRPDESGILRAEERFALPGGSRLADDPHLGLLLYGDDQIVRLAPGEPWHLALAESIDSRVGRPTGVREATIHRLFTADLTGDGRQEVLFSDDRRHQLTALALTDEGLEPIISWQVFEDRSYPYGANSSRETKEEPRALVGLDLNGDGRQDLAMLSHDRLVVYLAREEREGDDD